MPCSAHSLWVSSRQSHRPDSEHGHVSRLRSSGRDHTGITRPLHSGTARARLHRPRAGVRQPRRPSTGAGRRLRDAGLEHPHVPLPPGRPPAGARGRAAAVALAPGRRQAEPRDRDLPATAALGEGGVVPVGRLTSGPRKPAGHPATAETGSPAPETPSSGARPRTARPRSWHRRAPRSSSTAGCGTPAATTAREPPDARSSSPTPTAGCARATGIPSPPRDSPASRRSGASFSAPPRRRMATGSPPTPTCRSERG